LSAKPVPETAVEIGGLPIAIRADSFDFIGLIERRYSGFVCAPSRADLRLEVTLVPPAPLIAGQEELQVRYCADRWVMERGDFIAQWDPAKRRGTVRQSGNPYAIDSILRILHSLLLAKAGGFLLHAASAVRAGRAFLFAGVSGSGKTTLARLAPPDVSLLTDEISYVRRQTPGYVAFGTPFAGELGKAGENMAAPISAVYFLAKGERNSTAPIAPARAAALLLRNVLFFADHPDLVAQVFRTACDFVMKVPAYALVFRPESEVWELIK